MTQPLSLVVCGRRRSSSDLEIEDNNPSISQLVSALRDAFQEAEFDRIEEALVAREAELKRRNKILSEKVELGLLDRLKLAQDLEDLKESRQPPEKVKEDEVLDEDKEVISRLRKKNNRLEMEKLRLDRQYEALESRILGLEDDTTKLVNEMLLGSSRNEGTRVVNLENVFECLIEAQANGNLQISGEAKLDRVIEKQREEYATLEKRHKFEMGKMLKVENEFAALKRKHQLQLEEKVKVENELKACRVEIEGLKVELNVMEEKNRNEYEEIEQKHRSDRLEMLKVENEVKKLKEELKAVEEKHKYEYKALEQKHQSHLLEVENELKHCKAEFQGLKEEQSISDEKYEKLLEEVNKHRKEEDEVVNFDPQRQSKEVESDPNVVLENEISRLDKFRNAKHLGSKNMDKRSKIVECQMVVENRSVL